MCVADPDVAPADLNCGAAMICPDPEQLMWQLWGQLAAGGWKTVRTQCFGGTPPEYVPPTVTPGDVLEALRRVGLPALPTIVQPADKTLVNFETNFYTKPEPVQVDLTLLGQHVDVIATPEHYAWDFGDGTGITTTSPGAAYPTLTITHRYADADLTVHPTLATTYTARFRVAGGNWQDVNGTVTTTGPGTDLRIAEATPLLSGEHS